LSAAPAFSASLACQGREWAGAMPLGRLPPSIASGRVNIIA